MDEEAFAAEVKRADAAGLLALLGEDHPVYDGRGTAATVRMRGWALLALGEHKSPEALVFLLEELESGTDAYLIAAAARALRSCATPTAALAPVLARALEHIRYRDEPVSFAAYGEYAVGEASDTSPVRELLAALRWLGAHGRAARPAVEALREGGLPRRLLPEVEETLAALGTGASDAADCCALPSGFSLWTRRPRLEGVRFEDHTGAALRYDEVFLGHVTIVVFFYTRCDNPLKCSLTIAKLARVQAMLAERGLAGEIHTAAITYDADYDLPERLRRYGLDRGTRLGEGHRLLRTTEGFAALRRHFALGVNFVESLVNRHRLEAYVLDREGRVAASFTRLQWEEAALVERAVEELGRPAETSESTAPVAQATAAPAGVPTASLLSATALALLPKCPMCWGAYLSAAGVAAVPYMPLLLALVAVNLASLWWRQRAAGDWTGLTLSAVGSVVLLATQGGVPGGVWWLGPALMLGGSALSVQRRANVARAH